MKLIFFGMLGFALPVMAAKPAKPAKNLAVYLKQREIGRGLLSREKRIQLVTDAAVAAQIPSCAVDYGRDLKARPLIVAMRNAYCTPLLEDYLKAGEDPNRKYDIYTELPLLYAAGKCSWAIPILLAYGADATKKMNDELGANGALALYGYAYDFLPYPNWPWYLPAREASIDALIAAGAPRPDDEHYSWMTGKMAGLIEQRFALYQEKQKKPQAQAKK